MRLKSSWISAFLFFAVLLKIRAIYKWDAIKEEISKEMKSENEKEFFRNMITEKKKKWEFNPLPFSA